MRIKKFSASAINLALEQIKREFGEEAIILSQRNLENGGVEVTAAIDKKEDGAAPPRSVDFTSMLSNTRQNTGPAVGNMPAADLVRALAEEQFTVIRRQIDSLNGQMEDIVGHIKYQSLLHLPKPLQKRVQILTANGLDPSLANALAEDIFLHLSGEELYSAEYIDQKLVSRLVAMLAVSGPIRFYKGKPSLVALVGPTGAGKTTTVCKLAAMYRYRWRKKTALVSTDGLRIGATEQLKAFSQAAELDFYTAFDLAELNKLMPKLTSYELVLLDTPGAGLRDMKNMIFLKEIISAWVDETHLCLPLTNRGADSMAVLKAFSTLPLTGLIFTKLDETTFYGDIINLHRAGGKPISYLTNGQTIPDDLLVADRKEIAALALQGLKG